MKTSVMEVHDMLSVLSVDGVEKQIGEVAGVESVTVNHAAGTATVRYDETRLDVADIKSDVRQSGFEEAAVPAAAKAPTRPVLQVKAPAAGKSSTNAVQPDKPAADAAASSSSKPSTDAGASDAAPPEPVDDASKPKAP